jgi:hypothetical protein
MAAKKKAAKKTTKKAAKKAGDWVEMRLDDLAPNERNPRRIKDQNFGHLASSVGRFGLVENLVWNKRAKRLVSGHQRLKALRQLGHEAAMVRVVDLDEQEELALLVELNNPEAQGEWSDGLEDVLAGLEGLDGFDSLGLDELLPDDDEPEVNEIEVRRAPAMTWVLIGVATERFGEIADLVDAVAVDEDAIVEISAADR